MSNLIIAESGTMAKTACTVPITQIILDEEIYPRVKTNDIWEARVDVGRNTFRLLGFFHGQELIILTNSFQKKSQKIPLKEIKLAEKRKKEYLSRR
jgi:phage-related protein